jgi:hypothetical protein
MSLLASRPMRSVRPVSCMTVLRRPPGRDRHGRGPWASGRAGAAGTGLAPRDTGAPAPEAPGRPGLSRTMNPAAGGLAEADPRRTQVTPARTLPAGPDERAVAACPRPPAASGSPSTPEDGMQPGNRRVLTGQCRSCAVRGLSGKKWRPGRKVRARFQSSPVRHDDHGECPRRRVAGQTTCPTIRGIAGPHGWGRRLRAVMGIPVFFFSHLVRGGRAGPGQSAGGNRRGAPRRKRVNGAAELPANTGAKEHRDDRDAGQRPTRQSGVIRGGLAGSAGGVRW